MTRKFYSFSILALSACLLFTACSKTGPAGPAGPAGQDGAAGAQGAAGEQGPKGDTGTANVIYSPWMDVAYSADTVHHGTVIDTVGFYANIPSQSLTSDILNGGDMHIYVNLNTSDQPEVELLPYVDLNTGITITPTFEINNIALYSNVNASTETIQSVKYLQYRYVLIPGGTSGNAVVHPPNWKDYNAVKKFYNLPD